MNVEHGTSNGSMLQSAAGAGSMLSLSGRDWAEINADLNARSDAALAEARAVKQQLKAATFLDAPNIGEEGTVWRRLTTVPGRELVPILQDRMIQIAYWLYETNPLARWLIDVTAAFICGEGLPIEAENDDVKAVLEGFWNDPANRMDLFWPKHVREIRIFGELLFPVFTAEQTGRMRLGIIDPAQIRDVIVDPNNAKCVIGVTTKGWIGEVAGYSMSTDIKHYRTILRDEAEYTLSPIAREIRDIFRDGECFYFSINNVSNSPRGRSDLLPVADWCDVYEQYLYDFAEKWPQFNSFIWDLKCEGSDEKEIKKIEGALSRKSGSSFGHNEKVALTAIAPDLKAADAAEGARLFRNHILGKFGYPEHWYGGGGDVNRATASEMDAPALKMIQEKQLDAKFILEDIFTAQISRARKAAYLRCTDEEAADYSVSTPPLGGKDISKYGSMVQQIAASLVTAEMQGWVDKTTARRLYAMSVGFLGVDVDLNEVETALSEEEAKQGYDDYTKRRPQGNGGKPPLKVADKGPQW